MRWVHRTKVAPIHMEPGNRLELIYDIDVKIPGLFRDKHTHFKKVLGNYPVDKTMKVDVCGMVEFDEDELKELGLKDALVGVFGEDDGTMVADIKMEDLPEEAKHKLKETLEGS